ncbi:MAG: hypothetical protein OK454_10400, partial [Thaumarchaeota archaeon]|nr:hypothetical protein [Nitrososphaerota archaeon]
MDEERQRRVKEMAFKATQVQDERKLSSPFRTRIGSPDDSAPGTPSSERARMKSRPGRNEPFSPDLRPKSSHADLIFDMDDEDTSAISSPLARPQRPTDAVERDELDAPLPDLSGPWRDAKGRVIIQESLDSPPPVSSPPLSRPLRPSMTPTRSPSEVIIPSMARPGKPWGSSALPTSKLDLRDIMTEASSKPSALSASLAAQTATGAGSPKVTPAKLSQKERKKQQQQQQLAAQAAQMAAEAQNRPAWERSASDSLSAAPWTLATSESRTPLKEVLSNEAKPPTVAANPIPLVAAAESA